MSIEDLKKLGHQLWRRNIYATIIGSGPAMLYFWTAAQYYDQTLTVTPLVAAGGLTIVFVPPQIYIWWRGRQRFRQITAWAATGREPSPDQRHQTIDLPRRLTIDSSVAWMWGLGLSWISGSVNFDGLGVQFIRISIAIVMSAALALSVFYLLAESAMRPLFARVLSGDMPRPKTVGIRTRLTLTWVVGSATYLVAIAQLEEGMPGTTARPYVIGACAFALVIGIAVTLLGARSVARPLEGVAEALARVERGDLDASVPVDDAGEVGRLQAGFNRMVAGLRERDRLERLFARHVGPDVAQRAVAATELSGAQLEATVLFVDVIGSTTLAAERPAEAVVAMLNSLFAAVISSVGEEGGLVNQFQGDGALCIFGAPLELPDHAARALRATIRLRAEIAILRDTYPGFDAAIGVSTGLVVAGDVGTEDRSEYTVIGDAANEASRLTDQAKNRPSRVLVSEQTVRAAGGGSGAWLAAGELELRGRPNPTGVFEPA